MGGVVTPGLPPGATVFSPPAADSCIASVGCDGWSGVCRVSNTLGLPSEGQGWFKRRAGARPTGCRPPAADFPDVVGGWIAGARVCRFPNVLAPVIGRAFAMQLWDARQSYDRFESSRRAGARPTNFRPPFGGV